MSRTQYIPRISDRILVQELQATGAVLIEGPKWCGKTRTAEQASKSSLYMQDQDRAKEYLRIAETMPSILLTGDEPRLLDEWQVAPVLWDAVRFAVDQRGGMGHFILTGSAVPPEEKEGVPSKRHTGTGRISRMRMRPMSLFESGESNGQVSLRSLFDANATGDVASLSPMSIPDIAHSICRGGWPEAISLPGKAAMRMAINYVKAIVEEDIHRVDGVEKNPERVSLLLRSLARNTSTLATQETIIGDIRANDCTATDKTVAAYLNALRRIFVVEDIPAWTPQMRSKTAIRTSPKRQFVDPSIAAAVLRTNPEGLLHDFNTFGFLFESLCARDLRVYSQLLDGTVSHFRNRYGLEADLVISLPDSRWAPIEVKLGSAEIPKAQKNLNALIHKVDISKVGLPAFRMILTGTEFAYKLDDGVIVCPIGCLGP